MIFLRALLLTIPRFLILIAVLSALQNIEVSPLPNWTLILVAYLLHFLITYLFAVWSFGKRIPRWHHGLMVALIFVVFGTALEGGLFVYSQGGRFTNLLENYRWQSLYIVVLYALAVFFAAYRVKRKQIHEALPEGMES
ncbi:MAG: hypothetical protein Q7N87_05035 [Candidatus Uhrbacteria bacterium]|nr:hypothetical protein [Candidatus Uhrbacteria bacterium]MDP3794290.1 hypothetical protein [Candidatus Uhrbacteria bacterium]